MRRPSSKIRPSDSAKRADVQAAEQTVVEYAAGRLLIRGSRSAHAWSPFAYHGAVEVDVQLPSASRVAGASTLGAVRCTGALGDCRIKTTGDIHVERAEAVRLMTAAGDIDLGRAAGEAELTTASGDVHAAAIDGAAVIKSSSGDVRVDEIGGELTVKVATGDIVIERSRAWIAAKTGHGDVRVGAVQRGSVVAATGHGAVEIAVAEGTAAWLDLRTGYGHVRNDLAAADGPEPGADIAEVRVRTGYGDITICRARPLVGVDSRT